MDLGWLNNILEVIPNNLERGKTFYDISGFPRWETVNSNWLAFYLDKNEEHNLNTLFIDSLISLIANQNEIKADENYEVFREFKTIKGNSIDLVIKSCPEYSINDKPTENTKTDWAIIIENKIDSHVYNDLNDYFKSVNAKNKLGIVLTKKKEKQSIIKKGKETFYYITHSQLINEVQKNLNLHFKTANEKHLLLLKEYINNIENLYANSIMDKEQNKVLQQFQNHNNELKKLKKAENNLAKYIGKTTIAVFNSYGFVPTTKNETSAIKYFVGKKCNDNLTYEGFRFWVDLNHMIFNKEFKACFELFEKEHTKFGSIVNQNLADDGIYTPLVKASNKGGDNNKYNHVYKIDIPLELNSDSDFAVELEKQLETHFFKHENDFLNKAVEALKQAKLEEI
ncbi:PD-(D/E)XK nuclease family protein [Aestuariibaculum sp. YM273]|uniref:PD-(D/E)XK nuclease family protein n=1 Tax=Aestuariibaculum sp. YM273 TaxID=3070659 RepID=UPI0027DD71BE|nr:PD-(D/E)XK nuclease family protein [Aestuariibaculum sp. YM273]WMI65528.1 PD-(D/E)XK nuclease family protein [Aestuariibaculum sp. YM273]